MKLILSIVVLLVSVRTVIAQQTDTVKQHLTEVVITGYLSRQPIINVPASVAVLDSGKLMLGSQQSLLPVINTVPGVRMEERSPGSYRLSIRGSLLRSPFGVRNVKIYLNDLPFTDASGNTYLNLIDPALLQRMEILKGPDGSLFGANSGGVVLLDLPQTDLTRINGSMSYGSYGMFREHAVGSGTTGKFQWSLGEAYQRAEGYREQSAMKRLTISTSGKFNYGIGNVKLTLLASDLHYQTPGGLTLLQYKDDPRQARPGTEFTPGAVQQHAGIYNTTFFGGATHEINLPNSVKHVISVFGTATDYENPFITNYEFRRERNGGIRTFFEYSLTRNNFQLEAHAGFEGQRGNQNISNFENEGGQANPFLLSSDDIDIIQSTYFSKTRMEIANHLTIEAAASLNQYSYTFKRLGKRKLDNEWMPRIAASYRFTPEIALRASVSCGYSPPTIAEVRPSGGAINETLEAESGWNKEIGVRFSFWNGRLQLDASEFRYDLQQAIVRKTAPNDIEYFINAGGTTQTGTEILLNTKFLPARSFGFIRSADLTISYSYSRFVFDEYQINGDDYSGNWLTGVPRSNAVTGLSIGFPKRINLFVQSTFVSRIPLNDANLKYAERYELVQTRLNWTNLKRDHINLEIFVGADNLLNQKYSLGNDINAFGDRYYNAAPLRNFYGGVKVALH